MKVLGTWLGVLGIVAMSAAWMQPAIAEEGLGTPGTADEIRVEVKVIDENLSDAQLAMLEQSFNYRPRNNPIEEIRDAEFILDQMINLGKKIWALVEANKPVVNITTDTASALPAGAKSWQNLQGWKQPGSKVFQVTYVNVLTNLPVVDFSFRLLYTYGGNVKGKGRYLTHVTAVPLNVSVFWGYNFNASIEIPSIVNVGTHESPTAGMEILVKWKVRTILKHSEGTKSFFVQGDGKFVNLTDGN